MQLRLAQKHKTGRINNMVAEIVICFVAVLVTALAAAITNRKIKKKKDQEFKAAALLLKERQLQNAIDMNQSRQGQRENMVLVVSWKDDKKREYIFDPARGVQIGRDREANQICVPLDTVSQQHCMIFSNGDFMYVKDLNSANGTFLKRGFKTYRVYDCELLLDNDKVIVGGISFKVRSFWVDSGYL